MMLNLILKNIKNNNDNIIKIALFDRHFVCITSIKRSLFGPLKQVYYRRRDYLNSRCDKFPINCHKTNTYTMYKNIIILALNSLFLLHLLNCPVIFKFLDLKKNYLKIDGIWYIFYSKNCRIFMDHEIIGLKNLN